MKQLTFDFFDDTQIDRFIGKVPWTNISPGQWVETTHIETDKIPCRHGFGMYDDDDKEFDEVKREVKQIWAVRLLPVLVSHGSFRLPDSFVKIRKIR